jgi:hypothetical protein
MHHRGCRGVNSCPARWCALTHCDCLPQVDQLTHLRQQRDEARQALAAAAQRGAGAAADSEAAAAQAAADLDALRLQLAASAKAMAEQVQWPSLSSWWCDVADVPSIKSADISC